MLPDATPLGERNNVTIREDTKGRIILTGLHQVDINCFEDLMGALNFGSAIRQTDATAINAKSSRSHAVFSLNLVQRKDSASTTPAREKRFSMPVEALSGADTSVTVDSKLHFVDLAGSERLKNTGASGERAKEGISINAGLASLGKVISQLSSRQAGSHVSYRDSKLTRLLQDSLGGNAITYMIACVTPAEFHLSETLNTVQYAQRARAIQSKPRIQQVADEGDKQAVIDRLKAEVAFLRQQIRNSEGGDRRTNAPAERSERSNEREIELQNRLLDVQESYTALSGRHAKLISELTKASDFNGDIDDLQNVIGDSAMERLKRSHSFAESVEQVVLEYEKTIQSLESSLSNTRSSLSTTESNLLERETKCAYVETVNSQLQARMQKMMDRESNTETYLHDLESKLDGHATGEEKNTTALTELRKELSRARENEASCEEYISTLEERLAEADQDMELVQREVDRLEHVIDRQRSLGKLDNLLYELDHIQQNGTKIRDEKSESPAPEVVPSKLPRMTRPRNHSLDVLMEAVETAIPESDDDLLEPVQAVNASDEIVDGQPESPNEDDSGLETLEKASASRKANKLDIVEEEYPPPSPAQSHFVAEKLDNVTHELIELQLQHETTLNDYGLLNAKYEEALRTLAELQDVVDETRHPPPEPAKSRPVSFLEDARVHELRNGEHRSSSRSLSSELSSAEGSLPSPTTPVSNGAARKPHSTQPDASEQDENAARELENMRQLLEEHQEAMNIVSHKYAELQAEHDDSLSLIDNLKGEMQRFRSSGPTSPTGKPQVIRRMTSQTMTTVDRAHRSLASLRNIAAEEFEERPETMQNFELNINTAMHELHSRMERIQALEAENKNVKKEMETKATIISGLTRERSSLQGSTPMDMSVVSQMRDQVMHYEAQVHEMEETHDAREKELAGEMQKLNDLLESQKVELEQKNAELSTQKGTIDGLEIQNIETQEKYASVLEELQSAQDKLQSVMVELDQTSKERAEWEAKHKSTAEELQSTEGRLKEVASELEIVSEERIQWQNKHQAATESLQDSEKQLQSTLVELEAALASVESMRGEKKEADGTNADEIAAVAASLESEKVKHQDVVDGLNKDIEEQKATIATHLAKISDLETSHAENETRFSSYTATQESSAKELEASTSRITELTREIDTHKSAVEEHKSELTALQSTHEQELKELEAKTRAAVEAQIESQVAERVAEQSSTHEQALNDLQAELTSSKEETTSLLNTISSLLNSTVTAATLQDQLQDVLSQKQHFAEKYSELIDANEELLKQLETKQTSSETFEKQVAVLNDKATQHETKVNELAHLVATHEDALSAKEELIQKKESIINEIKAEKDKSLRLVEELEEQITHSFDQHHNRLSVIQAERTQALEDAKSKIVTYEKDIESYRSRIDHLEVDFPWMLFAF